METQTINEIIKDRIKQANKYKQEKKDCCICNDESHKEFLCFDCIKKGWKLIEVKN